MVANGDIGILSIASTRPNFQALARVKPGADGKVIAFDARVSANYSMMANPKMTPAVDGNSVVDYYVVANLDRIGIDGNMVAELYTISDLLRVRC